MLLFKICECGTSLEINKWGTWDCPNCNIENFFYVETEPEENDKWETDETNQDNILDQLKGDENEF